MSGRPDFPERAFVLGFDGVPWTLLTRFVEAGALPNVERVMAEGAAGPLESTTPPTTPLAWPSIATGTWPDRHGVYGFKRLTAAYRQRMYTSEDVTQPELWDLLSPALVGNVPMTYPAAPLDGTMVTGMMTPALNDRATHPPEFAAELAERLPAYRIGLEWNQYKDRPEEFLADLEVMVEARRALMRLFMRTADWRLFFFVFTAPDRLQHLVWEESVLLEHYRLLDDILGEVLAYVRRRDAVLFVVSDHGFGPISKIVYVNRALEEAGYLVRQDESGTRGALRRLDVSRADVTWLLNRVGISDRALLRYLPQWLVDAAAEQVPGNHALFDVDHARTRAFMFGSGSVFINDTRRFAEGVVPPAAVPALKAELKAVLAGLTDPQTGEPVLEVVDGEALYRDGELTPDLVVSGRDGYERMTTLTDRALVPSAERGTAASHRREGMVLAWGPTVRPGGTLTGATVVDVAPSLLHALGEPVGDWMDGRVLPALFAADSAPGRQAPETDDYGGRWAGTGTTSRADEDYTGVEDRLRGLGYLE